MALVTIFCNGLLIFSGAFHDNDYIYLFYHQVAHKDGIILNLQSELDATQQEFENTVEELGLKEEELNKLRNMMKDVQAEMKEMKSDGEENLEKVIHGSRFVLNLEIKYFNVCCCSVHNQGVLKSRLLNHCS